MGVPSEATVRVLRMFRIADKMNGRGCYSCCIIIDVAVCCVYPSRPTNGAEHGWRWFCHREDSNAVIAVSGDRRPIST